mmetsp:Transcript_49360/g.121144  ORF Transcript_49360/g.121144 Transcript_49360/m.121144 type:complete len:261 (+) Transcript_49360:1631-2413(+)
MAWTASTTAAPSCNASRRSRWASLAARRAGASRDARASSACALLAPTRAILMGNAAVRSACHGARRRRTLHRTTSVSDGATHRNARRCLQASRAPSMPTARHRTCAPAWALVPSAWARIARSTRSASPTTASMARARSRVSAARALLTRTVVLSTLRAKATSLICSAMKSTALVPSQGARAARCRPMRKVTCANSGRAKRRMTPLSARGRVTAQFATRGPIAFPSIVACSRKRRRTPSAYSSASPRAACSSCARRPPTSC